MILLYISFLLAVLVSVFVSADFLSHDFTCVDLCAHVFRPVRHGMSKEVKNRKMCPLRNLVLKRNQRDQYFTRDEFCGWRCR